MIRSPCVPATIAVVVLVLGAGLSASAQDAPTPGCADCHNGPADARETGSFRELIAESNHSSLDCTDCHESISVEELDPDSAKPHGQAVAPVDCGQCHDEVAELYQSHGRLEVGRDPDLPKCWSCHGAHDILSSSDGRSRVHTANLPGTCRNCHTDVDLVKKHDILRDKPIKLYERSVHGTATKNGSHDAATCRDCHSAPDAEGTRTAHRILSPADPESTIYHFNIPDTCGQCHEDVTREYWEGIHGKLVKRGSVDSPVCTHCHGEHGIISPDDPGSPVNAARLAEETCTPCHASALLNAKYGRNGDKLVSYIDSYHGLKSKAGDATVANCASCHGAHHILPSTDPASSIHPTNLQATCGECHPDITAELAQTGIHETAPGKAAGWPEFFRKLYIVLIVGTIGLMLVHNASDWLRRVKQLAKLPSVQRLNQNEVMQHWVLMLSFIVLVISGFSLRFSEAGWVKLLFGWEGGFEVRGIIHRVAAVVMMIWTVWHGVYLVTRRGRRYVRDMLVGQSDIIHVKENASFFLGVRPRPPRFGRFSYMEKTEYWALMWGTAVMAITGVLLWFDNYFVERWQLPKVVLDCALVIHFYEAWLAFLAILVWHIYSTVFNPSIYPMNPAWLTGKMPEEMYTEEHPEGPKLETRDGTAGHDDPDELQPGVRPDAEKPKSDKVEDPAPMAT